MNTKTIIAACLVLTMFTSCSKDSPLNQLACGDGTWGSKVSDELSEFNTAAINYSADPTVANCNSYKSAATAYLKALEGVRSCLDAGNQASFNRAINEAQSGIDQTNCSE